MSMDERKGWRRRTWKDVSAASCGGRGHLVGWWGRGEWHRKHLDEFLYCEVDPFQISKPPLDKLLP